MTPQQWLSVARYGITAALAGLTAAYGYYPSVHWLPVAIAVVGTLGIHVVPSYAQAVMPPHLVIPANTITYGDTTKDSR